ncbi:hypothetical protein RRF57_007378 [Xylaria bambusicola]|uniref:Uncharacterized protein n=1 Tax=Xylaria bambusicola TaxID=326684 RepID=A0AAN7UV13_9PEZI
MSCGMGISRDNQYEAIGYDEPIIPMFAMPGYTSSDGLNLTDEFDPFCSILPSSNQAIANCADNLPVEFYQLQTAYYRAQLALSHEAQQRAEIQAEGLQLALNCVSSRQAGLPFGPPELPEWDCPTTRLAPCPNEINQDRAQSAQSAPRLLASRNETSMNSESSVSKKTGNESPSSSESVQKRRSPDDVPLYNPGGCDAEAAVLELRNMENGFRAETSRRIAQVGFSRTKR